MGLAAIPNLISIARILLTPFIAAEIANGRCERALVLCLIAGASDAADGLLARQLGVVTRLGAYLDPIADKLLLTSLYLTFGMFGVVPMWLTVLVIGRDIAILLMACAGLLFTSIRDFPPSLLGKVSTLLQIAAAVVFLAACAQFHAGQSLHYAAVVAVTAGTAASGVQYLWRGWRLASGTQSFDATARRR